MTVGRHWWLAGILAGMVACSGPAVHYDYEAGTDFTRFQTYEWLPASRAARAREGMFDTAIMDGRVRRTVEAELAARGFRAGAAGQADFLVSCYPLRQATRSRQPHLGLGLGMGPVGVGVAAPVGERKVEAVGALVMEIQDGQTRAVVWKGTADSALNSTDSPDEADAAVQGAVRNLLKRFPPPRR
jgi:hypothetical protein